MRFNRLFNRLSFRESLFFLFQVWFDEFKLLVLSIIRNTLFNIWQQSDIGSRYFQKTVQRVDWLCEELGLLRSSLTPVGKWVCSIPSYVFTIKNHWRLLRHGWPAKQFYWEVYTWLRLLLEDVNFFNPSQRLDLLNLYFLLLLDHWNPFLSHIFVLCYSTFVKWC